MADFFAEDDFKKSLNLSDELVFDKQKFSKIKVELSWVGDDLDLCAFLVDAKNKIRDRLDLVFWGSDRRWLTDKPFDHDNFDPMKGKVSVWEGDAEKIFKNKDKWKDRTLPLSLDDSVIGSWDDGGQGECGERMHILLKEVDTRLYKSIIFDFARSALSRLRESSLSPPVLFVPVGDTLFLDSFCFFSLSSLSCSKVFIEVPPVILQVRIHHTRHITCSKYFRLFHHFCMHCQ